MSRLGPGRITAGRGFAVNFVELGDATAQNPGTGVKIDSPQRFIDAFNKLIAQFPNAGPDIQLALLLGLVEQTPAKLRAKLTDSLHNGGQAIGILATKDGELEYQKTAEAVADIADFAAKQGLWIGGDIAPAATQQNQPTSPLQFTQAAELVEEQLKKTAIATPDDFAAAYRAVVDRVDKAGKSIPNIAVALQLAARVNDATLKQALLQTIHNEGVSAGYVKLSNGGVCHIDKGAAGERDLQDYLNSTGLYTPAKVFAAGSRINAETLDKLRKRVEAFAKTGNAFDDAAGGAVSLSTADEWVAALQRLSKQLDLRVVLPRSWIAAALLEHTPAPLRSKLSEALDDDQSQQGVLATSAGKFVINKTAEQALDFNDFALGRGVWVGQPATPTPTPVQPINPSTRFGAGLREASQRPQFNTYLDAFLNTGSMRQRNPARPVTLKSVDDFVDALAKLRGQNAQIAGYPDIWLVIGLLERSPAELRQQLVPVINNNEAPQATVTTKEGRSITIDKTPDGVQDFGDFAAGVGIWAGGLPTPALHQARAVGADVRFTADRVAAVIQHTKNLLATGWMHRSTGGTALPLRNEAELTAALARLQTQTNNVGGYPTAWLVIGLLECCNDVGLKERVRATLYNGGAPQGYVQNGVTPVSFQNSPAQTQDVLDFIQKQGVWAGAAPRPLPRPRYNMTMEQIGNGLGNANRGEQVVHPSWADLMAMYGSLGCMGEIRTEADLDAVPRNARDVRAVWIPHLRVIRWANSAAAQYFGGNHDHLFRGDANGTGREGYITIDNNNNITLR